MYLGGGELRVTGQVRLGYGGTLSHKLEKKKKRGKIKLRINQSINNESKEVSSLQKERKASS